MYTYSRETKKRRNLAQQFGYFVRIKRQGVKHSIIQFKNNETWTRTTI